MGCTSGASAKRRHVCARTETHARAGVNSFQAGQPPSLAPLHLTALPPRVLDHLPHFTGRGAAAAEQVKRRVHMSGPTSITGGRQNAATGRTRSAAKAACMNAAASACRSASPTLRQLGCTTQPAPNTTRRWMSWGERQAARFMRENMRSTAIEQPYGVPRDTHAHTVCCRNGRSRVWIAACRGQAQVIARLVDEGADVNECDK